MSLNQIKPFASDAQIMFTQNGCDFTALLGFSFYYISVLPNLQLVECFFPAFGLPFT